MAWSGPSSTLGRETSSKLHPIVTRMTMNAPSVICLLQPWRLQSSMTRIQKTGRLRPRVADFWEDANDDNDDEFCLYDDDDDKVWECIDNEFQDWLDRNSKAAPTMMI